MDTDVRTKREETRERGDGQKEGGRKSRGGLCRHVAHTPSRRRLRLRGAYQPPSIISMRISIFLPVFPKFMQTSIPRSRPHSSNPTNERVIARLFCTINGDSVARQQPCKQLQKARQKISPRSPQSGAAALISG